MRFALINVDFAVLSGESGRAVALVVVDEINALTIVLARASRRLKLTARSSHNQHWQVLIFRVDNAFVDIDFAIDTFVSRKAVASV